MSAGECVQHKGHTNTPGIIISSRAWELQEFTTSYQDRQCSGDCTKIKFFKIEGQTFK